MSAPPPSSSALELLAVAIKLVQLPDGDDHVRAQLRRLENLGDADGIATWRAIEANIRAIRWASSV